MGSNLQPLLSIAIPVFNEINIVKLIEETYNLPMRKEIIIIDDGSTLENTLECFETIKIKYSDIRFIHNETNIGKARGVQKAIQLAKGEYFVILDSDYELSPQDITKMYNYVLKSQVSFLNGYRILYDENAKALPSNKFSRFSRRLMGFLTHLLYKNKVRDVLSGFKMFRTNLFKKYSFDSQRFGLETELIIFAISEKKRIAEIDVGYYPRTYKQGKKINIFDSIEILWVLFKHSSLYRFLKKVLLPGLILFLTSITLLSFSDKYFPTTDALPNNYTTLNLIFNHRLDLTNLKDVIDESGLQGIYVINDQGVVYPKTSIMLGILGAPFFYVAHALLGIKELPAELLVTSSYSQYIGKMYASFLASLSTLFVFLLLKRYELSTKNAFGMSLIFLLCTHVFNIAAQSNIQHAASLVFVTAALYAATFKRTWMYIFVGFIVGFATQIRISNIFYAIFFFGLSFMEHRKNLNEWLYQSTQLFIGVLVGYGIPALALQPLHIPGGYNNEILFSLEEWSVPLFIQNIGSLLFSPNFGLFVFSPFWLSLLLIPFVWKKIEPERKNIILPALVTCIVFILFAGSWWMWTGGLSLGARLLIESFPLGIVVLALTIHYMKKITYFKIIFLVALLISTYINILTTFGFNQYWHDTYAWSGHKSQIRNAWYMSPPFLLDQFTRQTYYFHHLHKKDDGLYVRVSVYRPSLHYKRVVKLHDSTSLVLPLTNQ